MQALDTAQVEVQLAAVAGLRDGLHHLGLAEDAEERAGQADALAWVLGLTSQAPVTLRDAPADDARVADEFAAAGSASLHPESPAYRYARGVYEALRWVTGVRPEPLIDL